jgi:hypothetical protein
MGMAVAVVCGLFLVGCTSTNSAMKKAEEGVKKAAGKAEEEAKEAGSEAKKLAKKAGSEVKEVAQEAGSKAKKAAEEAKEAGKKAIDAAKVAVLKPIEEKLPQIEEKVKGLSGQSAAKAKEKLQEVNQLREQLKTAAPEKWQSVKDKLTKAFAELKKEVGAEK